MLENGEIDLLSPIAYSEERSERFDFNDETLISNWGHVYTQPGSDIESFLDLEGKTVAILEGDIHTTVFQEVMARFDINYQTVLVDDYPAVFQSIEDQEVDAGVVNRLFAMRQESNYQVRSSPIIFNPIEVRFAATKDENDSTLRAIDDHLVVWKRDEGSVYYKSLNRWLGGIGGPTFPEWLKWGLAATGGLSLFFGIGIIVLRAQVRLRTRDLAEEIVERKRAEEALEGSHERLRTVLDSIDADIYVADLETYEILLANQHMRDSFGEDLVGKICWQVFRNESGPCAHCTNDKLLDAERNPTGVQIWEGQNPITKKWYMNYDRAIKWVDGRLVRLQAATNITERKRMEDQLRQQERLAAVGQLAAGIAHDFNNILTIIMLYAQMAADKSKGPLPLSATQAFEIILDESHKASQLVQQILDFSRHAMLKVQPLDLESFTEEVIDILRRTIPESVHLTLAVEAGSTTPLVVEADPTRIQQVLVNLATNARDAMPKGGDLRFGLSRVTLRLGEAVPIAEISPGEWVCLAVSDTGTGMTEEARQHIFEPFFTTKPVGEGTGLGLAQVYGIIRQHEGYIGVETEAGKGTTFRIYLPASEAEEEAVAEKVSAPLRGKGETILLVEDKGTLRAAGQSLLESLGYRVLTAANGREALEVYQAEGGTDLLITDVVMPEMGGKQLIQELRKVTPDLKSLAITGYAVEAVEGMLREAGFLDVVHKPFDVNTLARMVRRALDEG